MVYGLKIINEKGERNMTSTVKDVAKKANVSPSTVSRVINDHPSISAETKQRVRKIMDEMGYFPNVTAGKLFRRDFASA